MEFKKKYHKYKFKYLNEKNYQKSLTFIDNSDQISKFNNKNLEKKTLTNTNLSIFKKNEYLSKYSKNANIIQYGNLFNITGGGPPSDASSDEYEDVWPSPSAAAARGVSGPDIDEDIDEDIDNGKSYIENHDIVQRQVQKKVTKLRKFVHDKLLSDLSDFSDLKQNSKVLVELCKKKDANNEEYAKYYNMCAKDLKEYCSMNQTADDFIKKCDEQKTVDDFIEKCDDKKTADDFIEKCDDKKTADDFIEK
jgi:hypothetical protein